MTLYLGIDLLDVTPEAVASTPEHVERFGATFDDPAGGFVPQWARGAEAWTRTFRYTCTSRTELTALVTFLAARAGRFSPCWVPTWNDDLMLAGTAGGGATTFLVRSPGASMLAALGTGSARHLAILPTAGGVYAGAIQSATDNGDGTATVTLGSATGGPVVTVATARVCLAKYARLTTDQVTRDYSVPGLVRAALTFRELPFETP